MKLFNLKLPIAIRIHNQKECEMVQELLFKHNIYWYSGSMIVEDL